MGSRETFLEDHTTPSGLLDDEGVKMASTELGLYRQDAVHSWFQFAIATGTASLKQRWDQLIPLGFPPFFFERYVMQSGRFTPDDLSDWPGYPVTLFERLCTADYVCARLRNATDPVSGLVKDPAAMKRLYGRGFGWSAGVQMWLNWAITIGSAPLLRRWMNLQTLYEQVIGTYFATVVKKSQRFRAEDLDIWPSGMQPTVRAHVMEALVAGSFLPPLPDAKRRRLQSSFTTRQKTSAESVRRAQQAVSAWTLESYYKRIQDHLRDDKNNEERRGKQSANLVKNYQDATRLRAPKGAKRGVTHIYRGLHGPIAEQFERDGFYDDKGLIGFSWDRAVAVRFSQGQLVLRLRVSDVPAGTPWIWFGQRMFPKSTLPTEREVLLPPGLLKGVEAVREDGIDMLQVAYTPR